MKYLLSTTISIVLLANPINADIGLSDNWRSPDFRSNLINIRNTNGKLYAYTVLLFNENPHFVNLVEEDSITPKMMQKDRFHLIE